MAAGDGAITLTASQVGRRSAVGLGLFVGSSVAYQGSRLAVSLLGAAILAPATYGVWTVIVALLSYTTHGSLGILSGANRDIPIRLGRGDLAQAATLESAAFGWSALAGGTLALATLGLAVIAGPPWHGVAVPLAVAVLAQQLYLFFQVSLRARLQFDAASVQQAVIAVGLPIVALPLVASLGLWGLVGAQAAAYGGGALLSAVVWRRAVHPSLERAAARDLAVVGLPIMASGLAFAAMTTVDRWALLAFGAAEDVGHYGLAGTIAAAVLFGSTVIAQHFYPRLAYEYGRGVTAAELRRFAGRHSLVAALIVGPVAIALLVLAPAVIPVTFPEYLPSVGALQGLAIAYLLLTLASGFTNLLVVVGRSSWLLAMTTATSVFAGLTAALAVATGTGPTVLAVLMAAWYGAFAIGAVVLAWRATGVGR
jgi:O-antigen/teichoic acid export membrane protein